MGLVLGQKGHRSRSQGSKMSERLCAYSVTAVDCHSPDGAIMCCRSDTSILIMRPSSLGWGRILRRTLSVRLSVRPVIVAIGNVFSSTASVTDVLFGTH